MTSFGFFPASVVASGSSRQPTTPMCDSCRYYTSCITPKMEVRGEGRKGILVVGGAPSEEDDQRGRPFSDVGGLQLRNSLNLCGIDLDKDCWSTNALICHPPTTREIDDKAIKYCRPNLVKTIKTLNPSKIVLLGSAALRSFMMSEFREDLGTLNKWLGWIIPLQSKNAWVCCTYDPSYVVKAKKDREGAVVELWFDRHLQSLVDRPTTRPWEVVPDYKSEVKKIIDPAAAAEWIYEMVKSGKPVSFDYETNCLKPDRPDAKIRTAAFAYSGGVMACPVLGPVLDAVRSFLTSPQPKIGANTKFEDLWSRRIFQVPVNNWVWDCMLSAHHLDNRPGITSVKFQAFVRLGVAPWDTAVAGFLAAEDSVSLNRIDSIDLSSLLIYNGVDALTEYKIAQLQKEEMKWQNV